MMDQLSGVLDLQLGLAVLVAFIGGLIRGYSGFAGGLLVIPLYVLLFGPIEGIAVATLTGFIGTIQLVPRSIKRAYWPEVGPVTLAIAVMTPIGVTFLVSADPSLVRIGMGIFIILVAVLLMLGWSYRGPRGFLASAAAGGLAGTITGSFGVAGGPFFVLYYLAAKQPAETQRANIILSATATITILLGGLIINDRIGQETIVRAIVVTPLFMVGTWLGAKIFERLPAEWFSRVVLWLLIGTGISLLAISFGQN